MPIGMLGMYFFLASEAMFFVGLLGSFVVLESAGGQRELFAQSAGMLGKWAGGISAVLLVASSLQIKTRPVVAIILGLAFALWQWAQWHHLLAAGSGPSRNNFFACYFLFTLAHIVHLIGGLIALLRFICQPTPVYEVLPRTGSVTGVIPPRPLQIYWHFVNVVGILGLTVLYFPQ